MPAIELQTGFRNGKKKKAVGKSKKINRGKKESNKDVAVNDLNLDGVT